MRPLAQTFTVNSETYERGLILTSVELYFSDKPASGKEPVLLELRSVENRFPTPIVMPGSTVFLSPDSCTTPAYGDSNDITAIRAASTKFQFEEPIYLSPGKQYAIVVHSNNSKYKLFGGRIYDFLIGTTEKRINKQTDLDDLFLSQSGSVWHPDATIDMMVKMNRASFTPNTVYSAYLENNEPGKKLLSSNPILTDSGSTTITVLHPNHGFGFNDYVNITGLDSATTYNGILGSSLLGDRQITAVDHTGYQFTADSAANSSLRTGGDGVIVSQQVVMDQYNVVISSLEPTGTAIGSSIKLTSGSSYAGTRNTTGHGYATDTSFNQFIPNDYILANSPELIATVKNETVNNSSRKSVQIKLDISTSDSAVSPIIDLQRISISGIENVIDKQDSVATSGFNVPLSYVDETDPQSGTSASKHITKPIALAETAVGLKILLAANRPSEADFDVYYRTSTGDEVIGDKSWTELTKDVVIAPDEDPTIFREYTYLAGGIGGTLTPFSVFQIKIVMNTTNTSKIPRIKDLRAIALVV